MFFHQTRACMMTRTVIVQSWTIQAVQNPAKLQATGEKLTPQPTQKKKKTSHGPVNASSTFTDLWNTQNHNQTHCREAGTEGLCSSQAGTKEKKNRKMFSKNIKRESPIPLHHSDVTLNCSTGWADGAAAPLCSFHSHWPKINFARALRMTRQWQRPSTWLSIYGSCHLPGKFVYFPSRTCIMLFHIVSYKNMIIKPYQGFFYIFFCYQHYWERHWCCCLHLIDEMYWFPL